MNYIKHYKLLIRRAKRQLLENVYVEKHHIVPKCLGGSDNTWNLVCLTPEEHYLAHLLLVKIFPDNDKLVFAAKMLIAGNANHSDTRSSNKLYGWLKRKFNEINTRKRTPRSEETKRKISKSLTGKSKGKGRVLSDITKKKMSDAKIGKGFVKGNVPWNKGKNTGTREPMSDKTKKLLSDIHKNIPQEVIQCPHCNKEGGKPAMMRWHFDNCKELQ